ncbi:MAG: cysteine--tRNA ligase [Fidelibacterota bacterium]
MDIKIFNSLSRKKETFIPLKPNQVKIYTCGPTVYDVAHIGNFRAFVFEDFVKRVFQLAGFSVYHVMNITDVDDRTILRSQDRGVSLSELTDIYTKRFFDDLALLKVIPADVYPRATKHIAEMIAMIEDLLSENHAYQTSDGSIYFALNSFQDYGQLTRVDMMQQQTTERIQEDEYSKDNPQDFALWKSWKPEDGDVYWDSPWGKGRPGWHIECSAMSTKYLGNHFDIHCGGVDNMFPHHENEIAQSVCATGEPFVNVWIHNEHLLVDGGKMSKSLGNFYTIQDLIDQGFSSEMLRYLLLSTHYHSKVNFSLSKKHEALQAIQRIRDFQDRIQDIPHRRTEKLPAAFDRFLGALVDDFDAPGALGVFYAWIKEMNSRLDRQSFTPDDIAEADHFLERFNAVFDFSPKPEEIPDEVRQMVAEREAARRDKNWSLSDEIRDRLKAMGWLVKDTPGGTKCSKIE